MYAFNTSKKIFSILLLAVFAFGCQGSSEPSKDQLISDLKSIHESISSGDHAAAAEHFKAPEGMSKEKMAKQMPGMLKKNELSMQGIEILDKEGKFGKLSEVFPERGESWMKRNKITTPDDCYGLGFKNAEVAAFWDGSKFLLIRLDDVGKL